MRPDTTIYCESQMALVRDAVLNHQGYLLIDEFQQVIYEFRRNNPRFPAWVVWDDEGYFFPISYDDGHLFTFTSKNHALEDITEYIGADGFNIIRTKISNGKYRFDWVNLESGETYYSCLIHHPVSDEEKVTFVVDIIRQIVEFRNACLEDSGTRFSPFLENPPEGGKISKKRIIA